ncbi:MAG: serine/threonine protein kinase [Deltaproteobacteria bacterium]|nr:serine/threonine protein kinase [Deltaproteobacteria bacterium]
MELPVFEGDVIAGKYRVDRFLGVGGMGVVVAATPIDGTDKVAIKMLLPEAAQSEQSMSRFEREQRTTRKICNEHVPKVLDSGVLETGSPYMVMEFVEGNDLAEWLETRGPLPIHVAVDYVLQAAEALAEAHALGIVHRDLKPANLLLTQRADGSPCIKVLDFGISKVRPGVRLGASTEITITETAAVMGSPLYMSPEQMLSSKQVDARSDIWSLGIILHELITGALPFEGDNVQQVCSCVLNGEPTPARQLRPDCPEGLEAVILRCLQKHPSRRFLNIAGFAQATAPFGSAATRASVDAITCFIPAPPKDPPQLALQSTPPPKYVSSPPSVPSTPPVSKQRALVTLPPTSARRGWSTASVVAIALGSIVVGIGGTVWLLTRYPAILAGKPPVSASAQTNPPVQSASIPSPASATASASEPDPAASEDVVFEIASALPVPPRPRRRVDAGGSAQADASAIPPAGGNDAGSPAAVFSGSRE